MTVNVDCCLCTGGVDAAWPGACQIFASKVQARDSLPGHIVDEGHVDAEVSELLHQMVHVVSVWECDIVGTCAVLILGLEEDDRPTYAELSVKPRQGSTSLAYHS